MRIKKTAIVDLYGVRGEGADKAAAKLHAVNQIQEAFEGYYEPEILQHRGHIFLLHRCAKSGWSYSIIAAPDSPIKSGAMRNVHSRSGGYQAVKDAALFHLAQNSWVLADGETVPDFVTNQQNRQELKDLQQFYMLYAEGKQLGLVGEAVRSYADHKRFGRCVHPQGYCQKEGLEIPQAA